MSCGRAGCGCGCRQGVRRFAGIAPHRARLGPAMVPLGAGEAIGRWGPVTTYGGRTEGEPCPTGILDSCGDVDVHAWLYAAKTWYQKAAWCREMAVIAYKGKPWPEIAKVADAALPTVAAKLSANLGYLDGQKVAALVQIQRELKTVCEAYSVAVDNEGTVKIPPNIYEPSTDPEALPPVIPWPGLFDWIPQLGGKLVPLAIGAVAVIYLLRSKSGGQDARAS